MNTTNRHALLIQLLLEKIPSNIKPINYLMEKLALSKGPAYRVIKGERELTLSEAGILAADLNISLDELTGLCNNNRTVIDISKSTHGDTKAGFLSLLHHYHSNLRKINSSNNVEIIVAMNHLLTLLTIGFKSLFKFNYYKSLHHNREILPNQPLSKTSIPPEVTSLCENVFNYSETISSGKCIYLVSSTIFSNTIKDIQYYYKRRLISAEEIKQIKEELIGLIKYTEYILERGETESGFSVEYYLSTLDIISTSSYEYCDEYLESVFWLFPSKPFRITDPQVCDMHKKRLESIKKHAILISQSNELLQFEFIAKQYETVNNIDNFADEFINVQSQQL